MRCTSLHDLTETDYLLHFFLEPAVTGEVNEAGLALMVIPHSFDPIHQYIRLVTTNLGELF